MSPVPENFTVRQTHGPLWQPGVQIRASSDNRGWSSLYASLQRELPFEGTFGAVEDQLVVLHLDGPVMVHRRVAKGEDSRLIPAGGMFMMPGGMDFGARVSGAVRTLHLYLRRALLQEVAADILDCDHAHIEILPRFGERDPLIERLILGIGDVLRDDDPTATMYVDYLARAVAARLVQQHSSASSSTHRGDCPTTMAKGRLGKAIDFMEANLDQSIGLLAISDAAGLSPSHFARQFRASVGQAPHQHLMQRRVEQAKRRLGETNAGIAEIAITCGFANQEHLSRLFKRACGTTPAAYRKARRD
jgi:AraC family transcriptional regulator